MKNSKKIAVLMLYMQGEEYVTKLSIKNLQGQLKENVQLHILANGHVDSSDILNLIKKDSNCFHYYSDENLGVAGGRNFLLEKVLKNKELDYISFIDNDIIPTNNYIEQAVDALEMDEEIGILGATVLDFKYFYENLERFKSPEVDGVDSYVLSNDDARELLIKNFSKNAFFHIGTNLDWESVYIRPVSLSISWAKLKNKDFVEFHELIKNSSSIYDYQDSSVKKIQVGNVAGCTQFFRVSLVKKLGLLDVSFNPYGHEDSDFCIRAIKNGFKNYTLTNVFLFHGTDNRHTDKWINKQGKNIPRVEMLYKGYTVLAHKHFNTQLDKTVFARALLDYRVHKDREIYEAALSGIQFGLNIISRNKYPGKMGLFMKNLEEYRDVHKGGRCFIVGNGPSLQKTDLNLLKNEYSFGMNRIYLLFENTLFRPSYYACVNNLVIRQFAKEISSIDCPKFLELNCKNDIANDPSMHFLKYLSEPKFYKNPSQGLWHSATVTYVCLQLAYFMGFSDVILLGVDHNFVSKGKPHEAQKSNGDDPNHFHPSYFGTGITWNLPDLETSEVGYRLAKEAFEGDGRRIRDATIDGKLNVFDKINYLELF